MPIIATAQSLSVFDIDTTNYPNMSANFYALDAGGEQMRNFSINDFEIVENGIRRNIIDITCPPSNPQAISSVLVFDVSGSMSAGSPRIESAKRAARAWINALPKDNSECALVACDDKSMLLQDFTKDRNKLLNSVDKLYYNGGTDYDQALIASVSSGLNIANSGKNKKVIIFLTDGLPNAEPQTQAIINFAKQNQITIFAVTLDMLAPQTIKEITRNTGGDYFENITNEAEAEETYKNLLNMAVNMMPCTVIWKGGLNCGSNFVEMNIKSNPQNISKKYNYIAPDRAFTKLKYSPTSIYFKKVTPGISKDTTITVQAINGDFHVTNIELSNPAYTISPQSFSLNKGQSIDLHIKYSPTDSNYSFCKFTFIDAKCTSYFYTRGGFPGRSSKESVIKLIRPNGGEIFVAGSDTVITWEGIAPDDKVTIEYRLSDTSPWVKLTDTATGLRYNFRVPNEESDDCMARVSALLGVNLTDTNMVFIPNGTFTMGNTGAFKGGNEELPAHQVTLTRDILVSKYEVTQKQYQEIMKTNSSIYKGDNLPMHNLSLRDVMDFCNKLSEKHNLDKCYFNITDTTFECNFDANGYRLPTEAEWEYACKAGSTTDFYNAELSNQTGADANLDKIAWYSANSNGQIHEVGSKEANEFGIFDMLGNVSEFVWANGDSYPNYHVIDPFITIYGSKYALIFHRGGCIYDRPAKCRSSMRSPTPVLGDQFIIGFRIVRTN